MLSVVIHEKDYTATVGEQVILKCSVSGFPCVKSVSWELISPEGQTEQLDKGLLKYHGSNPNDPSLVINDIREEDAGEYKCTVSNCMGSKSVSTMLTVNGDIPFVEILESRQTSVIGDQVKMECSISAIPPIISVSWQHRALGGRTIRHCFDQKRYAGGNLNDPCLVIHEVTKKDEGEYVCTASNLCGKQPSEPSYLTVNGGLPQLSTDLDEYSITEGYTAVLQCSVDALPSALAIKWSKKGGGSQIAIDNEKYMSGSLKSPSLVITNTEKIADEGLYTCEAENKAGSQNASVQLKIQKKTANTIPEKPTTFPPDANAKEQIERNVKLVHAKMVNELSGQISPKLENWPRFIEYLKAVLEPVDLQEGFHVIVQRLMSKMEIDHGNYKILSEAVKEADERATLIIRKAEADIKTIREGGRPYEVPAKVKSTYDGDNFALSSVQRSTREITEMFPGLRNRITGEGYCGSIVLTFTISEAKTPKQLSALFLGDMLRTKLHNGQIVLKDESGKPLVLQSSPEIRALTDDPTDMPTIRFSKAHYQFKQGQAGFLECTVVAKPEVEYIKWFRVNGEKSEEITLNNWKYFGEPKLPMLVISSLGRADQGLYFCRAGHQAGEAESDAAFVEIFDDTIRTHQFREPPGARNVYLRFSVPDDATSVQNTVTVRLSQTGTYFCAICFTWSFMGLQEFSNGKKS